MWWETLIVVAIVGLALATCIRALMRGLLHKERCGSGCSTNCSSSDSSKAPRLDANLLVLHGEGSTRSRRASGTFPV